MWYFTPFYAILRAVPDQRLGALLMLLAVVSFLFLPWLDRSPVKSIRYRGWISRTALALFAVSFIALGYLGLQPAEGLYVMLARIFAVLYFAFFLLMPFYIALDKVQARARESDLPCALSMRADAHVGLTRAAAWLGRAARDAALGRAEAAPPKARREPRQGRRGLAALARGQRRDGHRLAAARRAQLHQLLPRLPLAQVRALVAPWRRTWRSRPSCCRRT